MDDVVKVFVKTLPDIDLNDFYAINIASYGNPYDITLQGDATESIIEKYIKRGFRRISMERLYSEPLEISERRKGMYKERVIYLSRDEALKIVLCTRNKLLIEKYS